MMSTIYRPITSVLNAQNVNYFNLLRQFITPPYLIEE